MGEIEPRLIRCFAAVFPNLRNDQIIAAAPHTVDAWDSVTSVTLFATIEEEFELQIDIEDLADLLAFDRILAYLNSKTGRNGTELSSGFQAL
jgi:acyl carrier protein